MIKWNKASVLRMDRNIQQLIRNYPRSVKKGLRLIGERIMTDSKENYCPVDTGTMKGTGHVEEDPQKLKVDLVYGGPAAPYTINQHENLSYRHPVGEAKFLERPFNKAIPSIMPEIAARCQLDKERL